MEIVGSINKELEDMLRSADFSPEEVCFWSGAGISVNAPSNLPAGDSLTEEIIEYFCIPGTWNKLKGYFRQTEMQDAYGNEKHTPRLETVLENLVQCLGIKVLKFLDFSYDSEPNSMHRFFADHLKRGGIHITTNFDNCIENSLVSTDKISIIEEFENLRISSTKIKNCLIHIHGRYSRSDEKLERLGVLFRNIASGFPKILEDIITLNTFDRSFLVFIGYSGRDYFDVNPFFFELNSKGKKLRNLTVIWIKHSPKQENFNIQEKEDVEYQQGRVILESLENLGAKVYYLLIDTNKFLEIVTQYWVLSNKHKTCSQNSNLSNQTMEQHPSVSNSEKIVATAQVYSSMGIGIEVVNLSNALLRIINHTQEDRLISKIYFLLSNGFRDTGLYKQAKIFSRRLPHCNPKDKVFFHNRIGGDYWLRGNYLRAAYNLFLAIVVHGKIIKDTDTYYESINTFLHYYRDVKKIPLIGKLIPSFFGVKAFQKLIKNKEYILRSPHMRANLFRLYDEIQVINRKISLPIWIKPEEVDIISYFEETDSILGVINYSRWLIEKRIKEGEKPQIDELMLLSLRSVIIGDRAGILKAALSLKKNFRFVDPLAKITLKEIEWTRWMKIAWLFKWYYFALRKD